MIFKNIYYASKPFVLDGHSLTKYYFSRGNEFRHIEVKTKGRLTSIDSISQEEYLRWRISIGKEDYFKQKDYENITKNLASFGRFMRKIYLNNKIDISSENCTTDLEIIGFRKFKDFEEKAFLDALQGR